MKTTELSKEETDLYWKMAFDVLMTLRKTIKDDEHIIFDDTISLDIVEDWASYFHQKFEMVLLIRSK